MHKQQCVDGEAIELRSWMERHLPNVQQLIGKAARLGLEKVVNDSFLDNQILFESSADQINYVLTN